jgi:hypothetical protein
MMAANFGGTWPLWLRVAKTRTGCTVGTAVRNPYPPLSHPRRRGAPVHFRIMGLPRSPESPPMPSFLSVDLHRAQSSFDGSVIGFDPIIAVAPGSVAAMLR